MNQIMFRGFYQPSVELSSKKLRTMFRFQRGKVKVTTKYVCDPKLLPINCFYRLLSVKNNSVQMHLSATSHVGKSSSTFVARSVQMHLTAVRLN